MNLLVKKLQAPDTAPSFGLSETSLNTGHLLSSTTASALIGAGLIPESRYQNKLKFDSNIDQLLEQEETLVQNTGFINRALIELSESEEIEANLLDKSFIKAATQSINPIRLDQSINSWDDLDLSKLSFTSAREKEDFKTALEIVSYYKGRTNKLPEEKMINRLIDHFNPYFFEALKLHYQNFPNAKKLFSNLTRLEKGKAGNSLTKVLLYLILRQRGIKFKKHIVDRHILNLIPDSDKKFNNYNLSISEYFYDQFSELSKGISRSRILSSELLKIKEKATNISRFKAINTLIKVLYFDNRFSEKPIKVSLSDRNDFGVIKTLLSKDHKLSSEAIASLIKAALVFSEKDTLDLIKNNANNIFPYLNRFFFNRVELNAKQKKEFCGIVKAWLNSGSLENSNALSSLNFEARKKQLPISVVAEAVKIKTKAGKSLDFALNQTKESLNRLYQICNENNSDFDDLIHYAPAFLISNFINPSITNIILDIFESNKDDSGLKSLLKVFLDLETKDIKDLENALCTNQGFKLPNLIHKLSQIQKGKSHFNPLISQLGEFAGLNKKAIHITKALSNHEFSIFKNTETNSYKQVIDLFDRFRRIDLLTTKELELFKSKVMEPNISPDKKRVAAGKLILLKLKILKDFNLDPDDFNTSLNLYRIKSSHKTVLNELNDIFNWSMNLLFGLNGSKSFVRNLSSEDYEFAEKVRDFAKETCFEKHGNYDEFKLFYKSFTSFFPKLNTLSKKLSRVFFDTNLFQRKNLDICSSYLDVMNGLDQHDIELLSDVVEVLEDKYLQTKPLEIFDLINYYKALRNLSVDIKSKDSPLNFARLVKQYNGDIQKIIAELGKTIFQAVDKHLGLEINFEKSKKLENIHKDWDINFLGSLISNMSNWTPRHKKLFGVFVKSYMEDTLNGVLWPPDYNKYPLSIYGNQGNQEIVNYLRLSNLSTLRDIENEGLDVNAWLNASDPSIIDPTYTSGTKSVKSIKVLKKEFLLAYKNFQDWLGDNIKFFSSRKFFRQVEASINKFLSRKSNFEKILADNLEKTKLKAFHNNFLEPGIRKIQASLKPGESLPTIINDIQIATQNLLSYDPSTSNSENLRMRFVDPRDIGRLLFIGNRAKSCTAISSANFKILDLVPHIGTKYISVEDPHKAAENPNGEAVGCSRLYLGLNHNNNVVFAQDTVDGTKAHQNRSSVDSHAQKLMQKIGVMSLSPFKSHGTHGSQFKILGGRPSYYNWVNSKGISKVDNFVIPEDTKELEELRNWQPEGGWQN